MIQGIVTAVSVGLGCGTCCGSGISAVLFGYLTTHAKNMRQSVAAFLSFYLGKILAVAAICVASSALGKAVLDDGGKIGSVDIRLIADGCMVAIGIWMLVKWVLERKGSACNGCKCCNHSDGQDGNGIHIINIGRKLLDKIRRAVRTESDTEQSVRTETDTEQPVRESRVNHVALMGMGAGYGASPCAPLIMMAGYASTILPGQAFLSGCVFAVASAIAPMIFLLILSGVLSPKLHRDIPQYMSLFRLLSYILLIIIFLADML